ncbi:MAG: hypothetical protein GX288_03315 [Clostridiales bacterium]|nr:hypothetical protein [Clostridiales bacterium]
MGRNNLCGCFGFRRSHQGRRSDWYDGRRDDSRYDRRDGRRGYGPGRDRDFDGRFDHHRSSCCRSSRFYN